MNKFFRIMAVSSLIILTAIPAFALDGRRQGLFIGGDLGLGMLSYKQKLSGHESITSPNRTKFALQTDFLLGSGIRDNLQVFYAVKGSWFSMKNAFGENKTTLSGIHSLGMSYFLKPEAPSYYITGGLGLAFWALPFEEGAPETWYGFGIYGGAGYEFMKHYGVEFNIGYGHPQKTQNGVKASSNVISARVTFSALAY